MSVNIDNSVDPFYRYKRSEAKIENKSNKTIITNLNDVAKALHTKPSYILYYVQLEKSTVVTGKGEIKANLTKLEVEKLINDYVSRYILCAKCNYPELSIKAEGVKLYFNCEACGHNVFIPVNKFTKIIYKDFKN